MKLIAGLGNPGKKYEKHRHNLGFLVIDCLAEYCNIALNDKKFKALYGTGKINDNPIILVKPMTYMNLSGEAIIQLANYYKINILDVIIICDDLNIDFGRIRIRKNGSDGGHNGLKSIIECFGSQDFPRMRLGIGSPNTYQDVSDFVLTNFSQNEQNELHNFIEKAKNAVITIVSESLQKGMNQFNS